MYSFIHKIAAKVKYLLTRNYRIYTTKVTLLAFLVVSVQVPVAYGQPSVSVISSLPQPGVMVHLSPVFIPPHLQGLVIHPDNALQFDFLIHKGQENINGNLKEEEYKKLVKYFLASLTIPDKDQWV
ncbi:MAG: hypothetical protein HQL13_07265, partial [Candidatus Omnitrophica bacterium]|nr:hypothetical protein [Candidatus Omnitrophota bacterium]